MTSLLPLLACPKCRGPVAEAPGGYACTACALELPTIGKIPWLFADPAAKLVEWRHLLNVALEEFRRQEERLKARQSAATELAKKRLQREIQARVEHRKAVEALLEPLGAFDPGAVDFWRVLAGKGASTQMLTSYAVNAIRDWGWVETEENARALELVLAVRGERPEANAMAVLGAGAGRLAYDLHHAKVAHVTVTLDINPFLTFVADRMYSGKTLALQEFPIAPDGLKNVAVARKLAAPAKAVTGLIPLFGDVLSAPLAPAAFDVVVTPWLVDILPEPPSAFLARINALLKPGGIWLNHGSCAFQLGTAEHHISREELFELIAVSGFKLIESRLDRLPYLSSPASCQGRTEVVLTSAAEKVAEVSTPDPYRVLPPYLLDSQRPLPRLEHVAQLQGTHAYHAEVLGLIDGQRSAAQLGDALAEKYRLDPVQTRQALVGFLAKMYEMP